MTSTQHSPGSPASSTPTRHPQAATTPGSPWVISLRGWLGYHDGAAHLYRAIAFGRPEASPDAPPDIVTLPDTMGADAFTAAFRAGAALDPRATGELAHQLLTQVRADHLDT